MYHVIKVWPFVLKRSHGSIAGNGSSSHLLLHAVEPCTNSHGFDIAWLVDARKVTPGLPEGLVEAALEFLQREGRGVNSALDYQIDANE